jgi:hypothetical protein
VSAPGREQREAVRPAYGGFGRPLLASLSGGDRRSRGSREAAPGGVRARPADSGAAPSLSAPSDGTLPADGRGKEPETPGPPDFSPEDPLDDGPIGR